MEIRFLCAVAAVVGMFAQPRQEIADGGYRPVIERPEYGQGAGPLVRVDRGHHTFHADDGHYGLFADLLRRDGYRVDSLTTTLTLEALDEAGVLVIVNALHDDDVDDWVLPTSPAFTADEVRAVRLWIEGGGALLLVADHMPFPAAAAMLGRAFGVEFQNGFAIVESDWDPLVFTRDAETLRSHPITDGRRPQERITSAVTFVAGQAFRAIDDRVRPLLVFGPRVVSLNPQRAWVFDEATPRVPVEGWLQGAALEAGAGRVVVLGEAAMMAAQVVGVREAPVGMNSPNAAQNLQFLRNTMHWLSRASGY
jgi:hypothetical protein